MGANFYPDPVGDLSDQFASGPGGSWSNGASGEDDSRDSIVQGACPYGHGRQWTFLRYNCELVCGLCGVRIGVLGGNGVRY
jgi:hypothetical protein